jgi:DNA-binding transcriptional ArsR family regulator
MRKVKIDGKVCIGPTQSGPEIKVLRNNLDKNSQELEMLSELFSLAGNGTRLKILYLLSVERELCVCDIADILNMNISAISHQLKKLKGLKLLKSRRKGQTIYYSLQENRFVRCLRQLFNMLDKVYEDSYVNSFFIAK